MNLPFFQRQWGVSIAIAAFFGALLVAPVMAGGQVRVHDPLWRTPGDARARANPLAGRTDTEAGGARLFEVRCATCHGGDAQGGRRAPDLTGAAVQGQSDGALFWRISSGNTRAGMPGFSFLPELQRWQLVQHLRRVARR